LSRITFLSLVVSLMAKVERASLALRGEQDTPLMERRKKTKKRRPVAGVLSRDAGGVSRV